MTPPIVKIIFQLGYSSPYGRITAKSIVKRMPAGSG